MLLYFVLTAMMTPVKGTKRMKTLVHTPTPRKFKARPPASPSLPKQKRPPPKGHIKVYITCLTF